MYGRRQKRFSIFPLLVIAIVGGVIFYALDSNSSDETAPAIETAIPVENTQSSEGTPIAASSIDNENTEEAPDILNTPVPEQTSSAAFASYIPENAEIFIPTAGIRTSIVEAFLDGVSWDVSRLGDNAGHLQGTPWVGDGGNAVLSGHVERSNGQPGIFANLNELNQGDLVVVMVDGNEWRYSVIEITKVAPDDLTPLRQSGSERLTLITCDNYNFLQDAYLDRTVVVAERIG